MNYYLLKGKCGYFLQTMVAINDETRVKILNFINIHGSLCL